MKLPKWLKNTKIRLRGNCFSCSTFSIHPVLKVSIFRLKTFCSALEKETVSNVFRYLKMPVRFQNSGRCFLALPFGESPPVCGLSHNSSFSLKMSITKSAQKPRRDSKQMNIFRINSFGWDPIAGNLKTVEFASHRTVASFRPFKSWILSFPKPTSSCTHFHFQKLQITFCNHKRPSF